MKVIFCLLCTIFSSSFLYASSFSMDKIFFDILAGKEEEAFDTLSNAIGKKEKLDINQADPFGNTLIFYLAPNRSGYREFYNNSVSGQFNHTLGPSLLKWRLKKILKLQPKLNIKNQDGNTVLQAVLTRNQIRYDTNYSRATTLYSNAEGALVAIRLILKWNKEYKNSRRSNFALDINNRNKKGETALLQAMRMGNPDIVELLIQNGAMISDPSIDLALENEEINISVKNIIHHYRGLEP